MPKASKQWRSFAAVALWFLAGSACDSLDTTAAGAAANKSESAPAEADAKPDAKAKSGARAGAPEAAAAPSGAPPPEPVDTQGIQKALTEYRGCVHECMDDLKAKETDRETCKLNCETVAEALGSTLDFAKPEEGAHDDATPVGQGCARSCNSQMASCERLCDEQKGKETDRETCRLLCTANSEICLDTCHIEAAKRGK